MLEVKVSSIAYNLDQTSSETTSVAVAFQGYNGNRETLNLSVNLTPEDMDEGTGLDDLSRKQIETLARKKGADYINPPAVTEPSIDFVDTTDESVTIEAE